MERLHISVTGFVKMTAPSFKNLPGRLSTPASLEISIFFNSFRTISSVVGFDWNLVVMFKFLQNFLLNRYHNCLGEVEAFVAMFLPY